MSRIKATFWLSEREDLQGWWPKDINLTVEEEEIYQTGACKIFVRRDGSVAFKCKKEVKTIELGDMELRYLQGVSDMVKALENEEERLTTDEPSP